MKKFFKTLGWALSVPFVALALLFNYWNVCIKARKYRKNPKELFLEDRLKPIYKGINKILYIKRIKVVAEDFDKIPSKPILFIPNHKSWLDPLVFFKAYYESGHMGLTSMVAKIELKDSKAVRATMTLLDGIFIKRDSGRSILECYNTQMDLIKKGYSVVVYPEGTRVAGDEFGIYQPTVLKVAYQNYIAINPIVAYGLENLKERDSDGKHKIYIKSLKLVQPNNFINTNQEALMAQIQQNAHDEYINLKNRVLNVDKK